MWIPNDAQEIEAAARRGDLRETATFDAKAGLPTPKKNSDLATDVAAMTVDGGVLVYGVQEDEDKRPTVPVPIPLAGAAERIDQIVLTSVSEAPHIEITGHPCPDDPSKGYLVVVVPQSARAPHQVTVGGDLRFYGRGATGNRRLTEGEIARLYRRRDEWEQDRDQLLVECIDNAPFAPSPDLGYMHAFARPIVPDRALWDRATKGGRDELLEALAQAARTTGPKDGYSPGLHSAAPMWERRGSDAWRLSTQRGDDADDPTKSRYLVFSDFNIDGRGYMFCGRAADRIKVHGPDSSGRLVIIESIIAGNLASFLAMLSALYGAGGYHGHVDIGVAVTGIQGGQSDRVPWRFEGPAYNAPTYPRTERVAAAELSNPEAVARAMLRHLMEATAGDGFDPFGGEG